LVEKLLTAGLSPKTIVNYVQVLKLVVASAVNEEGEQIHSQHMVRIPDDADQRSGLMPIT